MTTKTLSNEKKWLLHNLAQSKAEQQHFIDLAKPLLDRFISSNLTEDHYGGYAVELRMFKPQSAKYENEHSLISLSKETDSNGWSFAPSLLQDDDCYVMKDNVLIKHHLFSFLWYSN